MLNVGDRLPHWLSHGPVWIGDVIRDPRTSRLDRVQTEGWNTGLVIPVKIGGTTLGVLDFYAPRVAAPEPQFLKVLRSASTEIGHFYQRALALEKLRESEERFSSTMKLAAIGIAHVEEGGRFRYVNPQLCEMLGYTEQELLAMTVKEVSHPGDANVTDDLRDQLRSGGIQSFKTEKRYLRKDGSAIWVGLTIACKRDRAGRCEYDISVVEDISSRKGAEERIQYLATHDGLTGLPNRVMFTQLLGLSIETARRYDRKFAVLFIDLDRFKVINDTLGHEAGDVLLREIAARLRECLRASDVVARLGGDEFVVLLQEINDPAQAAAVARNILTVVMKPVVILGQECRVTASVGVCLHPDDGQDDQSIMKNADMAMYLAKEEGKNNFQFFTSRMKPHSIERLALETNLRRALELERVLAALSGQGQFQDGRDHGRRGAAALAEPRAGLGVAGALHPARRGDGPDRADRQMGAQDGVRAERRVAEAGAAPRRHVGESVDAPDERRGAGSRDRGSARGHGHGPGAARARGHREHDHAQRRARRARADGDQGLGRSPRDRRFRHRLLVARAPEALPDRHAEGRPLVHPRGAERRRGQERSPRRSSRWARR